MPLARIRYHQLPTEQRHPQSRDLDRLSTLALLRLITREDARVVQAVRAQHRQIAAAVDEIARRIQQSGRLFFIGAGTSGRLGILEAAECPPTFQTPPSLVQAVMAGGRAAVFRSREGAEDQRAIAQALIRRRVRGTDVVVGIAASGVTPFVDAALVAARRCGARTILITCHPGSNITADRQIALQTGPELLTGSTRLKAGTATKLVLNMLTLGAMVRLGKTYGNLMVDLRPTSRKLRARAVRVIRSIAGCSEPTARAALRAARGQTKVAALIAAQRLSAAAARRRLLLAECSLRRALTRNGARTRKPYPPTS